MASDKIFCSAQGTGLEMATGCRCFSPSTDPAGTFSDALTAGESCYITVQYIDGDGNTQLWHWSSLARYVEGLGYPEEMHPNTAITGILYLGNETLIRALLSGTEAVVDENHPPFVLVAPGGSITLNGVQLGEVESEPTFIYLSEYVGMEIVVIAANNEIILKDVVSNARNYGRYNTIAIPAGINTESGLQPGEDLQYHKGVVLDSWNQLAPIFTAESTEDAWGRPSATLDLTADKWRMGEIGVTGVVLTIPPGTMINESLTIKANPPGADIATYLLKDAPMEFMVATESNQPFTALVGCDVGTYAETVRLSPFVGVTVNILFEAQTYSCTFKTGTIDGNTVYYLGNGTALGLEGNDEPFLSIDMAAWDTALNYVLDGRHAGVRYVSMWTNKEVVYGLTSLEITANGTYPPDQGFGWGEVTVNVPSGGVETITTPEEMDAKLVAENVGNAYRYIGAATEFYATGDFYIVEEDS